MTTRRDTGAALLSTLLLIAVMSAAALVMVEGATRAVQRSRAADDRAISFWYAQGAEELGRNVITGLTLATAGRLTQANAEVLGAPIRFELDGGFITARLEDATNCFNLNVLGGEESAEEGAGASEVLNRYQIVLEAAGVPESDARALAEAAADWIDADQTPRTRGAEDGFYTTQVPPYRAANQPMADLSELRAVSGYSQELIESLRALVCVRPERRETALNVNTLRIDQAALLSAALSGELDVETARIIISERPLQGWQSAGEFLSLPEIEEIAPDSRRIDLLGVQSSHFELRGLAAFRDGVVPFRVLYAVNDGQPLAIVQRIYGES